MSDLWHKYITEKKIKHENGYYILTDKMAQNMKKIRTSNSESTIYRMDEFLIKIPKSALYHDNIIRSYRIGSILNNLRHIVPNFVSTLGIFSYNKQVMVAQEYIPGETLETLLAKKKITFSDFLNTFIQILFALEISQRQYRFCHYDLHLKNIIMKPIDKPYSYTIVIDTKRYDLTAEKYIPIIIDFGFASIRANNTTIGSYDFPQFGMMHYLIQGVDMYKFLFHAYAKSEGNIYRQISSLFLFYGSYDPYRLLVTPTGQFSEISKTYLKKVSFSRIATYTPLEMVLWIANSQEYKVSLLISDRNISLPIKNIKEVILPNISSYIASKYIQKIFDTKVKNRSEESEMDPKIIELDLKMLEGYKIIKIPDEFAIRDKINAITNTELGKIPPKLSVKFITQLKPYLQYLYTIRELGLENEYKTFIQEFIISRHYQVYTNISLNVERAKRWAETLKESILNNTLLNINGEYTNNRTT